MMEKLPWEIVELIITDIHPLIKRGVCKLWRELTKRSFIPYNQSHIMLRGKMVWCPVNNLRTEAAINGWLSILKWIQPKCIHSMGSHILFKAAVNDQLDVVKWLLAHGCKRNIDFLIGAMSAPTTKILDWIMADETPCRKLISNEAKLAAVKAGNLAVLDWICRCRRDNNLSDELLMRAARKGHVNVLAKYLGEWSSLYDDIWYCASGYGHLNVLEHVHSRITRLHHEEIRHTVDTSVARGYVDILEWLDQKGYLMETDDFTHYLYQYGKMKTLIRAIDRGYPCGLRVCVVVRDAPRTQVEVSSSHWILQGEKT